VVDKKSAKQKKQAKKPKAQESTPPKSSDEENHGHRVNRIRTNAGYVTVVDEPVQKIPKIELIKTSSGLVRVEPVTPKQKYFRALPPTPKLHGFREEPGSVCGTCEIHFLARRLRFVFFVKNCLRV